MTTKLYILDENGKFIDRKIKTKDGKEYTLHKRMIAFLKDLPEQEHGAYTVIQKKVDYYVDKSRKDVSK